MNKHQAQLLIVGVGAFLLGSKVQEIADARYLRQLAEEIRVDFENREPLPPHARKISIKKGYSNYRRLRDSKVE